MKHTLRSLAVMSAFASLLSVGSVFAADAPAKKTTEGTTVKTTAAKKDETVETCKHKGLKGKELSSCITEERAKMHAAKKEMNKPSQAAAPAEPTK